MTITLTSKNQITIPKKLVNELHLKEGDLFNIRANNNILELTPVDLIERTYPPEVFEKLERLYQKEKTGAKPLTPGSLKDL